MIRADDSQGLLLKDAVVMVMEWHSRTVPCGNLLLIRNDHRIRKNREKINIFTGQTNTAKNGGKI